MTPVYQRIVCRDRGDCMTCAVASILDLTYYEVPTWCADIYDWTTAGSTFKGKRCQLHHIGEYMADWFTARNLHPLAIAWRDLRDWRLLVGAWCIASIPSQGLPGCSHAVVGTWVANDDTVGHEFVIAHDPNPNNGPYAPEVVPTRITFLVPINPAHLVVLP